MGKERISRMVSLLINYFINTGMLHVELIDEVDGRLLLHEFMSFQNLTVSIDCKMI